MGILDEKRVFLYTANATHKDETYSWAQWTMEAPIQTPNPIYKMKVAMQNVLLPNTYEKVGFERRNNRMTFVFCPPGKEKNVKTLYDEGYHFTIQLPNPRMISDTNNLILDIRTALKFTLDFDGNRLKNKGLNKERWKPWVIADETIGTITFVAFDWLASWNNFDPPDERNIYDFDNGQSWDFKILTEHDIEAYNLPLTRADIGLAHVLGYPRAADLQWFGKEFNDPYNFISEEYRYVEGVTQSDHPATGANQIPYVMAMSENTVTIGGLRNYFGRLFLNYSDVYIDFLVSPTEVTAFPDTTAYPPGERGYTSNVDQFTIAQLTQNTEYYIYVRAVYDGRLDKAVPTSGIDPFFAVKFADPIRVNDAAVPGAQITTTVMRGCCRARTQPNLLGTKYIKIVADVNAQNLDPNTNAFSNTLACVPTDTSGSSSTTYFNGGLNNPQRILMSKQKLDSIRLYLFDDDGEPLSMHNDWLVELSVVFEEPEAIDIYQGINAFTGPAVDFHAKGDPGSYERLYNEIRKNRLDLEQSETAQRSRRARLT